MFHRHSFTRLGLVLAVLAVACENESPLSPTHTELPQVEPLPLVATAAPIGAELPPALNAAFPLPDFAAGEFFAVGDPSTDGDVDPGDGVCATASGTCTFRAAIQETNALPGPQTVFLPSGLFTTAALRQGGIPVEDTVQVVGAGALHTTLNLFSALPEPHVRVSRDGVLVLRGVTVESDRRQDHQIVVDRGGTLVTIESRFTDRAARGVWGISVYGRALLYRTLMARLGAALHSGGETWLVESLVKANAPEGELMFVTEGGQLRVVGSSITENAGTLLWAETAISPVSIVNTTIAGNTSWSADCAIRLTGDSYVNNSTIAKNSVGEETTMLCGHGTVTLANTILGDNRISLSQLGLDCRGQIISEGYNLITNNECNVAGDESTNTYGDHGSLWGPVWVEPTLPFGVFDRHVGVFPGELSPARNGGNPAAPLDTWMSGVPVPECQASDQRGMPRDDGLCDIGAIEVQAGEEPGGG